MLAPIAATKRGASESGQRYGVYTDARLPSVLHMAMATAFFSSVWPRVDAVQPMVGKLVLLDFNVKRVVNSYRE